MVSSAYWMIGNPAWSYSTPLVDLLSSPMVPYYTVKLPVTKIYRRRGARLSDVPSSSDELFSDAPSSPSVEPSSPTDSTLEQLIRLSHHLRQPPDYYSHSAFTSAALSEPTSYRDAILHPE
jgi:hypothetical protein